MIRPSFLVLLLLCLAFPLGAATDRPLRSFPAAELAAGSPDADVVFVVAGDNRPTAKGAPLPRVLAAIFAEIGLIRPDFVLWTGDTVYGYCDSREELEQEYRLFEAVARPLAGVPLFNAPGNHEIHSQQQCSASAAQVCGVPCSEEAFRARFGQLYGSFDYAGVHFIALDTDVPGEQDAISGDQLAWLRRDLESNKEARAIFLASHTEFYSSPRIDPPAGTSHPAVANRCELHDLFRRYPVKAVFSGHEHLYWRELAAEHDGIDYFVAGGAGAPLYAPPDQGGFSHYLVVRLSQGKVSYDVVEPGRLYVEEAPAPEGEARFWIVNSNDTAQPLALRGLAVEVPASLGACADLTVTAETLKRDVRAPLSNVTLGPCSAAGPGRLRIPVNAPPLAQGSVLVTIRHKTVP